MKSLDEKKLIMERESNFIKGTIHGKSLQESMKAFNVMKKLHEGVKRGGGLDYSTHTVRVAHQLIAAGVDEDYIIAAALLHDVIEDCNVSEDELRNRYNIHPEVVSIVAKVTKWKGYDNETYFGRINSSSAAMLVKISDRLHNISTMHGAFSHEKMLKYVEETYTHIIPMCRVLKYEYPQYANISYIMKNQIETICEIYESLLALNKAV